MPSVHFAGKHKNKSTYNLWGDREGEDKLKRQGLQMISLSTERTVRLEKGYISTKDLYFFIQNRLCQMAFKLKESTINISNFKGGFAIPT